MRHARTYPWTSFTSAPHDRGFLPSALLRGRLSLAAKGQRWLGRERRASRLSVELEGGARVYGRARRGHASMGHAPQVTRRERTALETPNLTMLLPCASVRKHASAYGGGDHGQNERSKCPKTLCSLAYPLAHNLFNSDFLLLTRLPCCTVARTAHRVARPIGRQVCARAKGRSRCAVLPWLPCATGGSTHQVSPCPPRRFPRARRRLPQASEQRASNREGAPAGRHFAGLSRGSASGV